MPAWRPFWQRTMAHRRRTDAVRCLFRDLDKLAVSAALPVLKQHEQLFQKTREAHAVRIDRLEQHRTVLVTDLPSLLAVEGASDDLEVCHLTLELSPELVKKDDEFRVFVEVLRDHCSPGNALSHVKSIEMSGVACADALMACVAVLPCVRRVNLASAYPMTRQLLNVALSARQLQELHLNLMPSRFLRFSQDFTAKRIRTRRGWHEERVMRSEAELATPSVRDLFQDVLLRYRKGAAGPLLAKMEPIALGSPHHCLRLLELHHCFQLDARDALPLLLLDSLEHLAVRRAQGTAELLGNGVHTFTTALVKNPHRLEQHQGVPDSATVLLSRIRSIHSARVGQLPYMYQSLATREGVWTWAPQDGVPSAFAAPLPPAENEFVT